MKAYRLLRNNKEIGPYSAEELKGMGLKAYDLIWVDGKSASWRYPGEIEELQSFAPPVEEQPFDRFFKPKNDTKKPAKEVKPATSITETPLAKTEKPRIRIKAEWSVAKEPVTAATQQKEEIREKAENIFAKKEVPVTGHENKGLGWQEAFDEWKQEKPELKKKVAAPITQKAHKRDNNYVYESEMLEEDPANTALNNYYDKRSELNASLNGKSAKRNSAKYINYITPVLFILVIGAFAIYMNKKSDDNTAVKNTGQPIDTIAANNTVAGKPDVNDEQQDSTALPADDNSQKENIISTSSDINDKSPASVAPANTNEKTINNKTAISKPEVSKPDAAKPAITAKVNNNKPVKKEPAANTNTVTNNTAAINKIQQQAGKANGIIKNNATAPANNTVKNETPARSDDNAGNKPDVKATANQSAEEIKAPATIGSYVQMQTVTQEEGNKRLQVRNISDYKLDLVVVDIQYYDANNKFTKGESIYLHNIPSGKNMLVKTPDDKMASRITAKVSLVSSDEKGIYLVGE